jgi:hypothetical protein
MIMQSNVGYLNMQYLKIQIVHTQVLLLLMIMIKKHCLKISGSVFVAKVLVLGLISIIA